MLFNGWASNNNWARKKISGNFFIHKKRVVYIIANTNQILHTRKTKIRKKKFWEKYKDILADVCNFLWDVRAFEKSEKKCRWCIFFYAKKLFFWLFSRVLSRTNLRKFTCRNNAASKSAHKARLLADFPSHYLPCMKILRLSRFWHLARSW